MELSELDVSNQRSLRKLMISIRAKTRRFGLLLAVCDNQFFQDSLIETYEAQLREEGIETLQVELEAERPSLRAAL
ncbi:MAG: tetratricopeptide repeat protein, partial [Cyanobacteria bacterium J06614_10]